MLIRVKYVDERFDMVRPDILDRLLEAGKVREFQRSDGWVMPGTDRLRRKKDRSDYSGTDRRRMRGVSHRVSEYGGM
ncbi:MAG: hypothetical protein PHP95_11050 [Desulfuromonadaceae bacterium]|nr:hypothetical protein [Desulfuromonadaceae bacterium]MDD2848983.1 hypothetical protein [Desulfuromonadaceae bacterium]MDD4130332.1 hypothetical protein [Desulfuromonadaceae bacterium]